jgi:hypothetical protein
MRRKLSFQIAVLHRTHISTGFPGRCTQSFRLFQYRANFLDRIGGSDREHLSRASSCSVRDRVE